MNKDYFSLRASLPFLLVILLAAAAYFPGLSGGFMFDDMSNIVENKRLHVETLSWEGIRQAAFSGIASRIGRPLSQLSFWANYYLTGLNPFYFKLTNLTIHLLNGILLFYLTLQILFAYRDHHKPSLSKRRVYWIAITAAGLWLLHPLGVTSVLYVVQRMNSLAALFTLAGLICYMAGRERLDRTGSGFAFIVGGLSFGFLALLSKENGALLPLFMLVIETTVFRFSLRKRALRIKLNVFFAIAVGLPAVVFFTYIALHPGWLLVGYSIRDFTLYERVLTEARVLWHYVYWIFFPDPGQLSLFHDDIVISQGILTPYTTMPAIVGLLLTVIAAFYLRSRAPFFAFAVFWFLGGQCLESTIINLELVYEHRNYIPMYGPLLAFSYLLFGPWMRQLTKARGIAAILIIALFSSATTLRAIAWSDVDRLKLTMAAHHPESPRSNYVAGVVYMEACVREPGLNTHYYGQARQYFLHATALDKGFVRGLFATILLDQISGKPLDRNLFKQLKRRLATMPLRETVVPPFEALVDWLEKETVSLDKEKVLALFTAALGNASAGHGTRADLFSLLSMYYFNALDETREAIGFAVAAVKEAPWEVIHHINLARLAVIFDNYSLAIDELDRARALDTRYSFALLIQAVADRLHKNLHRHNRQASRL